MKHTFNGFETGPIDPHDSVPIRVLKTLLRIDIPQLRPKVQERIEETFDSCMSHGKPLLNGIYNSFNLGTHQLTSKGGNVFLHFILPRR